MKKLVFTGLLLAIGATAQTTTFKKIKLTGTVPMSSATRVMVQDAVTKEVGYIDKSTIVASKGYKEYVALLSQSGTDSPIATVISSTFTTLPTLSRQSSGSYAISSSVIQTGKTVVFLTSTSTNTVVSCSIYNGQVSIYTIGGDTWADNQLFNAPIEIRVYE